MKKIVLIILVLLMSIGGYFYWKYMQYENFKKNEVVLDIPKTVVIEKGENWKSVAENLEKEGVITSSKYFYYMIREKEFGKHLKTGEFEFQGRLLPMDVIKIIIGGKVKLYPLTIPEGYNKFDAAEAFKKYDWIKGNDRFLELCNSTLVKDVGMGNVTSCEGMLFPSTYRFARNTTMVEVIKAMDAQMQKVLEKYKDKIKKSGLTQNQVITLASIIEKETGVREEQPLIAAVFLNRLKVKETGRKLQSDPTVIYGMLPNYNGNLTREDLLRDHIYNTYTREGIPPAPIAFPGEYAIKSVVEPAATKYLYFVAKNNGSHYFSKTLKEHNAAVEHYQVNGLKTEFKYEK